MLSKRTRNLVAGAIAVTAIPQFALADCRPVAGTIDATVVGGEPVNVLGNVSGDLAGATRAVLTGQAAGTDGKVELDLAHDFVTFGRGSLKTTDKAVWTPVPTIVLFVVLTVSEERRPARKRRRAVRALVRRLKGN